ncbi:MAG: Rieske 2Fe-2S domain-containing protein [Proteobacteria bacterium]|nr:Rieske 2Fe-2S domain-containing protein [Pseudomonadota bacterium]
MSNPALALPTYRYPRSWWQIGWSHEIGKGEAKPLKYFNEDLVLWRGESGKLYLQDAFCLHLGAHRGVKGQFTDRFGHVQGDELMCPWHGWLWNGEGHNTLIPYSKQKCKSHLKIKTYEVREHYGMILMWWDSEGSPPQWQLPRFPELERDDWYPMLPFSGRSWEVKAHPQLPHENAADPAHVAWVHGAGRAPTASDYVFGYPEFECKLHVPYGAGVESTSLTPEGEISATTRVQAWGFFGCVRWEIPHPTLQIACMTPIDDEMCRNFMQQTSQRVEGDTGDEPTGIALRMLELQWEVIPQDYFAWEHMKYLPAANFAPEEADAYVKLRRWCSQFYPAHAIEEVEVSGE